jgi:kynurenine formamidase
VEVLDLTLPLEESTPVYRDSRGYSDPPTRIRAWVEVGEERAFRGASYRSPFRVSLLETGLHTATHVDAPAHFSAGAETTDLLPPATLVGPAVVVDFLAVGEQRRAADLVRYRSRASAAGAIPLLLLPPDGGLAADEVAELVAWRRPLVAVHGAIDGDDPACPATASLLRAGIFLAVDLAPTAREVRDGDLLVVAPLALRGVEGAPARVLAIRISPATRP